MAKTATASSVCDPAEWMRTMEGFDCGGIVLVADSYAAGTAQSVLVQPTLKLGFILATSDHAELLGRSGDGAALARAIVCTLTSSKQRGLHTHTVRFATTPPEDHYRAHDALRLVAISDGKLVDRVCHAADVHAFHAAGLEARKIIAECKRSVPPLIGGATRKALAVAGRDRCGPHAPVRAANSPRFSSPGALTRGTVHVRHASDAITATAVALASNDRSLPFWTRPPSPPPVPPPLRARRHAPAAPSQRTRRHAPGRGWQTLVPADTKRSLV